LRDLDEPLDVEDRKAAKNQRNGDNILREQVGRDEVRQQHAKERSRQEGKHQAESKAARIRIEGHRLGDFPEIVEIDHADRKDGAELDEDLEHAPGRHVEVQQLLDQDHVAGRGNRQEFRDALHQRKNDGGHDFPEKFHGSCAVQVAGEMDANRTSRGEKAQTERFRRVSWLKGPFRTNSGRGATLHNPFHRFRRKIRQYC
jgi:hypothetical protein